MKERFFFVFWVSTLVAGGAGSGADLTRLGLTPRVAIATMFALAGLVTIAGMAMRAAWDRWMDR